MTNNIHPFYGGPFSQWIHSPFVVDGLTFPTAEHYMMYNKAFMFGDEASAIAILHEPDPSVVKYDIGRAVAYFDEATWDEHKYNIVLKGNLYKFYQNKDLLEYLLQTGDSIIVEASGEDTVWGVGLWEHDPRIFDMNEWRGENLLGKVIMDVREHAND